MASPHSHPDLLDPLQTRLLATTALANTETDSDPLREVIYDSPDSDSGGEDDDGAGSDSTLDDPEELGISGFGHPLQRMPRVMSADHGLDYDSDSELNLLLSSMSRVSSNPSRSQSVSSLNTDDTIDFEELIDALSREPSPFVDNDPYELVSLGSVAGDMGLRTEGSWRSLMVRRLERSSQELFLLLGLNMPELREDPWNPAPHIVRAIEKDGQVYLFLQRLSNYNKPPLLNVAHYIDFFRQVLEGLSFLHEQRIAGLNLTEPSSYMVDLSSAPHKSNSSSDPQHVVYFDRLSYPVRYYLVDFTDAKRIPLGSSFPSSSPATPSETLQQSIPACPFRRDVQDCGTLFEKLLSDVPALLPKFKSLTRAMIHGSFTADDARRLFEALFRALDANIFETRALSSSVLTNNS
ncbi:hypothetical protein CVT26_008955 [Gymnopilus dilepis]|uniref:Protein kinase domain-containing protein n=1 Tax=Gymnopilus dilepis TaxID=231916 RepID=A0A409YRS1_9AGAR|nr:hypothetical protein CVT26_008955 [Gymnopilus dilepis]